MPYMLVKLYDMPDLAPLIEQQKAAGIEIRRPFVTEKHTFVSWVHNKFGDGPADECEVAFSRSPISCFVAIKDENIIGFACYDVINKDFYGPIGVAKSFRGKDIGKALLLSCLHAMAEEGYAFAVIPTNSEEGFYLKTVNNLILKVQMEGFI